MKNLLCLFILFAPFVAMARPVTYPGGVTVMVESDAQSKMAEADYTFYPQFSFGFKSEHMNGNEKQVDGVQLNWLVKRWNNADSQANIYLNGGVGVAEDDSDYEPAAFGYFAADWEDRRFYTSYKAKFLHASDIDKSFVEQARVGITPYIGNYGDIHTWLMFQVEHYPGGDDIHGENILFTPLVRLFKDEYLGEAGVNNKGDIMLHLMTYF